MTLLGLNPISLVNSILCIPLFNCPAPVQRVQVATTSQAPVVVSPTPIITSSIVKAVPITTSAVPTTIRTTTSALIQPAATKAAQAVLGTKYWPGWAGIENIFAFGNSYTTTQFDINGAQPSKENPIGNPAFPGVTSSGGLNWIGFLTTIYNQSQVLTYNLAAGGATVDTALVKPFDPSVLSLIEQVEKKYLPKYAKKPASAPWKTGNTLFTFWIGINDVANSYLDPTVDEDKLLPQILSRFDAAIEQVYQTGARNFAFLNVPPVNKSPLTIITTKNTNVRAADLESLAITSWNVQLIGVIDKFKLRHMDVTAFTFDTHLIFDTAIAAPAAFAQTRNIVNTTGFCAAYQNGTPQPDTFIDGCGVPVNQYFWLNGLHPTPAIHDAIAVKLVDQMKLAPKTIGSVLDAPPAESSASRKRDLLPMPDLPFASRIRGRRTRSAWSRRRR